MGLIRRIVLPCLMGGALGITMLGCSGHHGTNPPSITSFSPEQTTFPNDVILAGTGFTGVTAVNIGGVPVTTFSIANDNQITAYLQPLSQTGVISVTNPSGTSTTTNNFYVVPTISGLSTGTGLAGSQVNIEGYGFVGASVAFIGPAPSTNSYPVTTLTVVADQITATVPSGAPSGAGYTLKVSVPGPSDVGGTNSAQSSFTIQ